MFIANKKYYFTFAISDWICLKKYCDFVYSRNLFVEMFKLVKKLRAITKSFQTLNREKSKLLIGPKPSAPTFPVYCKIPWIFCFFLPNIPSFNSKHWSKIIKQSDRAEDIG